MVLITTANPMANGLKEVYDRKIAASQQMHYALLDFRDLFRQPYWSSRWSRSTKISQSSPDTSGKLDCPRTPGRVDRARATVAPRPCGRKNPWNTQTAAKWPSGVHHASAM